MNLLEQANDIKKDLFSEHPHTPIIIKKCYSLCRQMNLDVEWIKHEHKGYPTGQHDKIPQYRIVKIEHGLDTMFQPIITPYFIEAPISTVYQYSKMGAEVYVISMNPITYGIKTKKIIPSNDLMLVLNGVNIKAQDFIEEIIIDLVEKYKIISQESSEIMTIISLIQNKLRKLIRETPKDEKEINDAVDNLFIGAGLDKKYEREKIRITYSSKTYQPDFVFKNLSLIVESKYCTSERRKKEIIAEINDYIMAFKKNYENIIFIVYDNTTIRDEDEFKKDLQLIDNVVVLIIKH